MTRWLIVVLAHKPLIQYLLSLNWILQPLYKRPDPLRTLHPHQVWRMRISRLYLSRAKKLYDSTFSGPDRPEPAPDDLPRPALREPVWHHSHRNSRLPQPLPMNPHSRS